MRWAFLFIFCIAFAILPIVDDTVLGQEDSASYILAGLYHEALPGFSRVVLVSNAPIEYVSYELQDPYRIVIDLVGVTYCELQEHADYDEGLVKSIDVINTPYARIPDGLDKYFYAVDYIIVEPTSKLPYIISEAEGGKVLVLEVGQKPSSQTGVTSAYAQEYSADDTPDATQAFKSESVKKATGEQVKPVLTSPKQISTPLLDYVHYEVMDDVSLVIISSNNDIGFDASRIYEPYAGIVLKPRKMVFTDLQERARLDEGAARFIEIIKDSSIAKPAELDEYYYPVKYITIETAPETPFDVYSNEDGTIVIAEFAYARMDMADTEGIPAGQPARTEVFATTGVGPRAEVKQPVIEVNEVVVVEGLSREEIAAMIPSKEEIIRELRKDIKLEDLLRQDKIQEAQAIDRQDKKKQIEEMVERVGQEVLKDLIVRGKGTLTLNNARLIALENNVELKNAQDEVKLAKMKKSEAMRALLPQVKLKASQTTGTSLDVDFVEEVYGVQGEQSVFQGRRLWNTYKQSKVNVELAQARNAKIVNDLDFKVAETYYSAVTAIMNLKLQKGLLEEAEKVLKIAESRHNAGLSTKLEMLNVQSQYNQIQFQIASAERDLALARFKLAQAMNLGVDEEMAMDEELSGEIDTELQFAPIEVNLDECLAMAQDNQPDILVNELLVETNEFGEKIAKGKDSLKVDVTGFFGKSGSHYETEDRTLKNDWNIGIKVSKPFWGNTANYSFSKEETNRKVGQTDRTSATAHAGELAILDSKNIYSEIKEAKINKQKARADLIEARKQIALEVKEAYYGYHESVIQVKNALEKTRFQEEAVKVARSQAGLNEALQSQLLEAIVKLVDEKSVYVKALSDYNLSLVKLNKAIGIADYFSIDKKVIY